MKNYLILSIILSLNLSAIAQEINWERLNPKPIEVDLKEIVEVPSSDRFIAIGENAVLMYSDDFGESWVITYQPAEINFSSNIISINCINENEIVALSNYGIILKSFDAGLSWSQMDSGFRNSLRDIYFLDDTIGFITKIDTIFRTIDGGLNWTARHFNSPPSGYYPDNLHFINDSIGFTGTLLSGKYVFKTIDKGETWDSLEIDIGDSNLYPFNIVFTDLNTAILTAEGDYYCIFKTTDGGYNWNQVYNHYWHNPRSIFFVDSLNGYALGPSITYDNMILRTTDGGDTWAETEMCSNYWYLNSLSVNTDGKGICVGDYGQIITSNDWGETWNKSWESIGPVYSFTSSAIVNDSILYLGSINYGGGIPYGSIFKSADYGLTFEMLWADDPIRDISFAGSAGAIFSELGTISYTPNGGQNWFGRQQFWNDLSCGYTLNDSVGFAYGDWGLIKTMDAWLTYRLIDLPYFSDFKQIEFKNQNEGFAVGHERSILLKTDDAGESWYVDSIGYNCFVNNINFINSEVGFIASNSLILKTIDGGETWYDTEIENLSGVTAFTKFSFPSEDTLFVIAKMSDINIYRSIDGGENWSPIPLECTSTLTSISFFDGERGMVFGEGGLIFTSDSSLITSRTEKPEFTDISKINIFPNPASEYLTIDLESITNANKLSIDIYSIYGKLQNTILINSKTRKINYNCSSLKPGSYLLKIYSSNKLLETKKFIKN